jgi:hypothetical protein
MMRNESLRINDGARAVVAISAWIRRSCLRLFCHARLRRSECAGIKLRRGGIQPVRPGVCPTPVGVVAADFAKVRMKIKFAVLFAIVAAALIMAAILYRRAASFDHFEARADGQPASAERRPVLVELFTSEGCSSCPPADELLMQLDQAQPIADVEVIALSEHVDYWNHLGWTDPFSSAQFSERQNQYASRFRRDDIYTPQMVVDGSEEFVGSNSNRAGASIEAAGRAPKARITLAVAPEAKAASHDVPLAVRIDNVPEITKGDRAEVVLAISESGLRSAVARGENSGRRLSHTAVARRLATVGALDPRANELTLTTTAHLDRAWQRDHLKAVVFIQERRSRRVLGVAAISLAKE